jgi:hypothetical protein
MTDEELERTVIETLVSHPPTEDCWKDPIHAVDRITGKERGWSSDDARVYVEVLLKKKLILRRTKDYQPSRVS